MKKRICSLFLVAGCLASTLLLPSCTKPTAHQLLSDAMEKTAALDQFSADLDIEVQMGAVGLNMKVPMSYQIAAAGLQGDTPVASGTLEMDLFGLQSVTQLYQEGDSIYYTAGLLKGKTARRDAPGSYDLLAEVQRLVQPLPEELLEELEMSMCYKKDIFGIIEYEFELLHKSRRKPCISSIPQELHIIKTKFCISSLRKEMQPAADDIHLR